MDHHHSETGQCGDSLSVQGCPHVRQAKPNADIRLFTTCNGQKPNNSSSEHILITSLSSPSMPDAQWARETHRSFEESKPEGGIKFSGRWSGSSGGQGCRYDLEVRSVEKPKRAYRPIEPRSRDRIGAMSHYNWKRIRNAALFPETHCKSVARALPLPRNSPFEMQAGGAARMHTR